MIRDRKIIIPLAWHDVAGFPCVIIEPHEFGNPLGITLRLPPECNGKINLPRDFFSDSFRAIMTGAFGEVEADVPMSER